MLILCRSSTNSQTAMSTPHYLRVNRTARVYTHGQLSDKTEQIWVIAHGYGMLSEYFIKKFTVLDEERHFIIAPEALSRAYLEQMSGRVGASWMTSEMREHEIEDYLQYLDDVLEHFVPENRLNSAKLIGFGFSQGCATISRWVHRSNHTFSAMINWGGIPAKELFSVNCYNNLPIIFAFGEKDVYLTSSNRERFKEQCEEKGWSYRIITYPDGHLVTSPLLLSISEIL